MKFRLVILALALVVPAAFAGCFGSKSEPVDTDSIDPNSNTGDGGAKYPAAVKRTALTTTVTASTDWAKPGESIALEAAAPTGAKGALTYTWGYSVVPKTASTDKPLDTGNLAAGTFSSPMTFAKEGTYLLHCHPHPWMKLTVNVVKTGSKAMKHVPIIEDDPKKIDTYRFAPDEVTIAPGGKIVFWNNGTMMHTATQEAFEDPLKPIPGTGAKATFAPTEEGRLRVVVKVKDTQNGVGKAETKVLVDAAKPDAVKKLDAMKGEWNGAFPSALQPANDNVAASKQHTFAVEYEILALNLTFASADATGQGGHVKVELFAQGADQAIATADFAASGTLSAANLPSGGYVVKVTPDAGLQIAYEITGEVLQKLVAPSDAPAAEEHGGHQH